MWFDAICDFTFDFSQASLPEIVIKTKDDIDKEVSLISRDEFFIEITRQPYAKFVRFLWQYSYDFRTEKQLSLFWRILNKYFCNLMDAIFHYLIMRIYQYES